MRRLYTFVLHRVWVLALLAPPLAADAASIRLAALHLPPYFVLDEAQTTLLGGLLIERAEKMMKRAKIDYELVGLPPKRLYLSFAEGDVNMVLASQGNKVIEDKALVSTLPIGEVVIELYSRLPKTQMPASFAELEGKSVITMLGYSYAGAIVPLQDKATFMPTKNHDSGFAMLDLGRAPFLLGYRATALESIRTLKLRGINAAPLLTLKIFVQIQKDTPNAQEIMEKCNQVMKQMKAEGGL